MWAYTKAYGYQRMRVSTGVINSQDRYCQFRFTAKSNGYTFTDWIDIKNWSV